MGLGPTFWKNVHVCALLDPENLIFSIILFCLFVCFCTCRTKSEMGLWNGHRLYGWMWEKCQPFLIDCNMRMIWTINLRLGRKTGYVKFLLHSTHKIGGPRSPGITGGKNVKCGRLCAMATTFGQKKHWCKLRMIMTFVEVKGQQRSNIVKNALWSPNLVRRTDDAIYEWWWPLWRSKVNRGQI